MKRNEELNADIAEALKPVEPETPSFYQLSKFHKEENPGRLVISSAGCHTSKIFVSVDYHIQDFKQSLKSYVKDTTDFINKIKHIGELSDNSYLLTMDVKALYTNIPNDEVLQALKETMAVSLTYYVCNEPTHVSVRGYGQLRKYVRRIIVVNCLLIAYFLFMSDLCFTQSRTKAHNLRQPATRAKKFENQENG